MRTWVRFLDEAPKRFDAHIVVAACILSVGDRVSATLPGPEVPCPVGRLIAVRCTNVVHKHYLRLVRKRFNTYAAGGDHQIVIIVIGLAIRKIFPVRVVVCGDRCRTPPSASGQRKFEQITLPEACGRQTSQERRPRELRAKLPHALKSSHMAV
jgi:hypothetical protein